MSKGKAVRSAIRDYVCAHIHWDQEVTLRQYLRQRDTIEGRVNTEVWFVGNFLLGEIRGEHDERQ